MPRPEPTNRRLFFFLLSFGTFCSRRLLQQLQYGTETEAGLGLCPSKLCERHTSSREHMDTWTHVLTHTHIFRLYLQTKATAH